MSINTFGKLLLAGASSSAMFWSTPLFAQGADAEASGGDIIVTARRVEEKLQDVPISITVFNQAQLNDRNVTSTTDLAAYTPSLSVNQTYGPEKASFAIRGFNQEGSTAPTVGIYFADVVGIRAQGGTTSGNNVGAGAFMDLQNVQVLKGPQGTLFGRNTTGGAILLVPRKPTDKLAGYVEGTVGNYDQRRVQAALNVPLSDRFKVRAAIDRNVRDGYMKNMSGIGPDAYNNVNYTAGRLSIVANLTPDLENYTIAHFSNSNTAGYAYNNTLCNPAAAAFTAITARAACDQIARAKARGDGPFTADVSNPNSFMKFKQWQVINTTTWNATDTLTVKNIVSYGEFREDSNFSLYSDNFRISNPAPDLTPFGLPPLTPGAPYQYVHLDTSPGQHTASESTLTEELQLQGRTADGKANWVVGGYLEFSRPIGWNEQHTSIFLNCSSPRDLACEGNPAFIGFISDSRTQLSFNNHGVFAQGTYNFSDKFSLTAGMRYTFDRVEGANESSQIRFGLAGITRTCTDVVRLKGPGGGPLVVTDKTACHEDASSVPAFRVTSNKPTWLINLEYKPNSDIMAYAKYARGYRQGGLNFTGVGAETWDPEAVDSYEVGAKTSFRGGVSGYFNISAFYNNFRNQQISAGLIPKPGQGSGSAAIINAGKSRLWGVEVDASANLFEGFRVDLGYTYLNTRVIDIVVAPLPANSPYDHAEPSAFKGDPLALSPKNRVTLSATYTLPLDESVGKVSLGATFVHTDKQNSGVTGLIPDSLRVLPSSDLLNLNLNWANAMGGPFDLAFFATNVTNAVYPIAVNGGYIAAGFGGLQFGAPRIFGFRLRYNFGN